MSKPKPSPQRRSIRVRLLLFMLGISTAAIVILAVIAAYTTDETGNHAQQVSSQALLQQAQDYLIQLNTVQARENELILEKIQVSAQDIATYAQAVYDHPDVFTQEHWLASENLTRYPQGQLANSKDETSSVFLPNFASLTDQAKKDVELSTYLDYVFKSALENSPNIEALYFATPNQITRYYPNIDIGNVLPPDFKVTERPWYLGTQTGSGAGHSFWAPVYTDATGRGSVTTYAVPVYSHNHQLLGVLGMDITLAGIQKNIASTRFLENGYSFLLDQDGHPIALPDQGYRDLNLQLPQPGDAIPDLKTINTPLSPILSDMLAGQPGFKTVNAGGRDLFVAYAPLENTGWVLASVAEASTVLKAVGTLQTELRSATTNLIFARLLPVSLLIFAAVLILGYLLTNRFIKPVQNLAVYAQRVGSGEWDAPVPASSDDEVGQLSSALQQMASQLHELVTSLEAHVAQRTLDLEKRTTQLQVAAEVARDSTAVATTGVEGGVELLMDRAVNLIRDRFGFYHAGIFLLDELGEYAVLQAATGEAGRLLLEKRHRLKVGETGLVGYATGKSMPRITPDVTLDPKHYRNPYLPDTRAEMALPMRVGDQVIGALDVQSREVAAFDEDDITILQTLADQLAVAIENARLLQKLQSHVDELETLYSQYSQAAWQQLSKEEPVAGFIYDNTGIKPILRGQAGGNGHSPDLVEIPLKVRDEVIGYLEVLPEEKGLLPDDLDLLQAASGRISQAMESARLFEESQSRASREQIINQVANQVRSSIHMETILRNTVRELGKVLGASRTFIQLGLASPQTGSEKSCRSKKWKC